MKIAEVESFIVHQWLLVRIRTENSLSGIGESTFFTQPESVASMVNGFRNYLLGKDPLRIDFHQNFLYRTSSFRGAAVSGALSAIDVALWDIAGKHYETPVCNPLGGKHRDKIRMCGLVLKDDIDDLVEGLKESVNQRHTAIKIDPIPRGFSDMSLERLTREVVARVSAALNTCPKTFRPEAMS